MSNSILNSTKKLLGIAKDYTHFDTDITMHINSVFLTLSQLGVGPSEGYFIENSNDEWSDFMEEGTVLNTVKSYMYLKVKMLFDPPVNSAAIESFNRIINEFEFRLNVAVDPGEGETK